MLSARSYFIYYDISAHYPLEDPISTLQPGKRTIISHCEQALCVDDESRNIPLPPPRETLLWYLLNNGTYNPKVTFEEI